MIDFLNPNQSIIKSFNRFCNCRLNLKGIFKSFEEKIIIGSRGSELALWQANHVKKLIEKSHRYVQVDIKIIKTKAIKFLMWLYRRSVIKVYLPKSLKFNYLKESRFRGSQLKDLQTRIPDGLKLAAVSKRHGVEDVLIARKKTTTIHTLKENAVVATGSLRRKCQLLHLRPDITIVDLRGNVPSRIQKFLKSDWDAIILSKSRS
jgi:hydroxymethylbilane synthase